MDGKLVIATWVLVVVSFIAPQIQQWWKSRQSSRDRKESLFRTLMTFRGDYLSHSFIDALNSVTTVFHGKKYKHVIRALRSYIEHTNPPLSGDWENKRRDKLSDMLIVMSDSLGFDFDDTNIKRDVYYPVVLGKERELIGAIATTIKDGAITIRSAGDKDQYSAVSENDQIELQQRLQQQTNQRTSNL